MGKETGIAWCDHTFNPWWGCVKVSPACTNCYAEALDHRLGGGHWGVGSTRKFFGDKHWNEPLKWNREAKAAGVRKRVFCASMADVFEDFPGLDPWRERLWDLIEETSNLDWLLLTKRPENIARMLSWCGGDWTSRFNERGCGNVWLGTTVENQENAEERLPPLLAVPAVVHFVSAEPLVGAVDLEHLDDCEVGARWDAFQCGLDWVITGSESGPGARQQNVEWYRSLRDQCARQGAAFFLKQAYQELGSGTGDFVVDAGPGSWKKNSRSRLPSLVEQPYLDGVQHIAFPTPRGVK